MSLLSRNFFSSFTRCKFHKLRAKYIFGSDNIHRMLKLSLHFILQLIIELYKLIREMQFTYITIFFICCFHIANETNWIQANK